MRIAFGFDIFYPETNGVITTTINLAKNLIELGHEVYFFVPDDKGFKENVIEGGIRIIHVKAVSSFIYKGIKLLPIQGWYLQRYFKRYHFDVVHNTAPWLVCMALNHAARRMHTPVLATHHTLIDNPIYIRYALKSKTLSEAAQKPIWSIVFTPFFRLVWMITAPNKETCNNVQKHVPEKEVRYVSNGIDISRFDDSLSPAPLPPQIPESWINKNTLLFIGRLGYEKAIDITLQAFSIEHKRNKDARLIIIGRGPAEENLKSLAQDLKLDDTVLFTGLIPNEQLINSQILKRVNSFVTASLSENQAITVIEALCSGCPVICADVENMKELLSDKAGWFFSPGDASAMASCMHEALTHPLVREAKAQNAKLSRPRFDGRKVAEQFVCIYKELLEMKNQGYYVYEGERKARKYAQKMEDYQKYLRH